MIANTLTIIRGDTSNILIKLTQADGTTALDITNATVYFTVKKNLNLDDDDASIAKDITNHTDAEAGETLVELTSEDTDIIPGKYYWDIQVKNDMGLIFSTTPAVLKVIKDVTTRTT